MAKGKHSGSSAGRGRARSGGKKPRSVNTHTRRGLLASDTSSAGIVSDVAREPDGNEDASSAEPSSRCRRICFSLTAYTSPF